MAALAVVLVTGSVEDTAARVSSPNPRVTTAIHAAFAVETDAKAASAGDFGLWADWESHFHRKCAVLAVLYSDAEVEVANNDFMRATGGTTFDIAAAGYAAARTSSRPTPPRPRCSARCAEPLPALAAGSPGRRIFPAPEGAPRMQHSHTTIESAPPIAGWDLSR